MPPAKSGVFAQLCPDITITVVVSTSISVTYFYYGTFAQSVSYSTNDGNALSAQLSYTGMPSSAGSSDSTQSLALTLLTSSSTIYALKSSSASIPAIVSGAPNER
ncbi:MAG: hypothetical protein ACHQ1H_14045 [Nitrososphaerales archaeon]